MKPHHWHKILSVLLLLGLCLSLAQPASQSYAMQAWREEKLPQSLKQTDIQQDASAKIDPQVLAEIQESGETAFFVWMTEKADLSPAAYLKTKLEKGQFVFDILRATAERTQKDLRTYLDAQGVEYKPFYIANKVFVRSGGEALALELAARPDVAQITPNRKVQLMEPIKPAEEPEKLLAVEPNISFINADDVWALGFTGANTVMAGNDTGLDETHPAIARHYRGCLNPPDCTEWDHNYNWWDPWDFTDNPWDDYGHGTHTTGTMVGDDGGDNQIGVAPGAQTIHCKNMLGGGGDDAHFIECFEWDLAPWDLSGANPNPAMAPDAVNNSWGYWYGNNPVFEDEIAALQAAGILVEVSAGNEGPYCSTLRSPGDYEEVLTTGSVNHAYTYPGQLTGFSSRGPSYLYPDAYFPDIMAPGESIRSALPGGMYDWWSGTSMAGPHATALVGLMWSAAPALRGQVEQTIQIIKDTAVPLTGQGGSGCGGDYSEGPNNDWGVGTIDALAAVQLAIAMGGAGNLDGTVTDASTELPIEDATVRAVHDEGYSWFDRTDATGYYTMTLAAGTYEVTASHPHYMSEMVSGVEVVTDTLTTQDFVLTPRGRLFGNVTDFDNGFPLVGATVTADDGTTATTDDFGFYEMWLDPGTYEVTASATDYAPESAIVDIFSGEDTPQDFALLAAISFTPSPLAITLDYGGTGSLAANLANRQPWDYNFEFKEKYNGYIPALNLGHANMDYPRGTAASSSGAAPGAKQVSGAKVSEALKILTGAPAYAMELISQYLIYFESETPGSWMSLFSEPGAFFAGDFINGDFSTLYVIDYNTNSMYAIDIASGAQTYIGPSVPVSGESWSGMTGAADGTMYASSTSIYGSTLYTVDLGTGAVTVVGNITGADCVIDIAITPDGTMYAHDICQDAIFSVDPSTGAGTFIGYTGFDANYAQGMEFEEDSGVLYLTAFNNYNYEAELRVVDVSTGNTTLVGSFGYSYEVDSTGFATGGFPPDVPWLATVPVSGTVPGEESLDVAVDFFATYDAGIYQPGEYLATLKVDGETGQPDKDVPVVMTVLAPETWGKLEGTVTGLGYCDANPAPLEEAEVFIEASTGMTWTLQTDASGHYQWWLDAAYSPLTITISYPEHQTGQATGVLIVGQETTTVDFDLRWLVPCVSTNPLELSTSVDMGDSTTLQITLANSGAAGTPFEIREKDAGYIPAAQGMLAQPRSLVSSDQASAKTTQGLNLPALPKASPLDAGDVLQLWSPFENDFAWGIAYDGDDETVWVGDGWTYENTIFEYLPDGTVTGRAWPYTYGPTNGPADGAFNWNTGMIWIAAVGDGDCIHEINPSSGETGNVICPPVPDYAFRGLAYDPETDTFFGGGWNDYTVYHFDASGNILESAYTGLSISGLAYNPETMHLFVMVNSYDEPVYVLDVANGYQIIGQFYISGWPGSYNGAGLEIDCEGNLWAVAQSNQQVFQFESGETASLCVSDVPWLSEDPVSGYLDADTGEQVIDVTFDAGVSGVDQPGEYHASLKVKSDDPVYGTLEVPVSMTVIPPDTWGKLDGMISSLGYCDENPWPIAEAQIVIVSSAGVTYTLESGDDGSYIRWLDEAGSPYTVYVTTPDHIASDPVTVEVVGQQTTTQDIYLRWMVPCVSVAPEAYDVEIPQGFTIDYPFSLLNAGAGEVEFNLRDKIGQETALTSIVRSAKPFTAGAYSSTDTSMFVRVPSEPSQTLGAGVLLIQDEPAWGSNAISFILNANGIPYDLINSGQISTWDFSPYKMIIIPSTQWQSYYDQFNSNLTKFEDFIDDGGLVLMSFCTQGEIVNIPFGGSSNWDGQDYNYIVDPAHPIFAGITNPYWGNYASHNSLSTLLPDDVVLVTTGMSPGGNPVMIERSHGAGMLVAGGQTFEIAWDLGWDGGKILENMIPYYYFNWEPQGDVPWLAQDPVEGIVAADSSYDVELIFTAFPTMPVGSFYTATLIVKSDDMVNDTINVPVTMTIVAPITALDVDATVTQLVGEQSTIVTHVITVTNQSNHPDTYNLVLEGYWWATWAPATVEELWPGESATVEIRVAIPPTVLPGSSDTVVVNAVSQANSAVFDSIALTTTAAEHVATFTPDEMALMGPPGHMVTYTLMLENTGNIADTFVMTYTNNTWDVYMVGDTSMEMEPGESHEVVIEVMIPEDAANGDWDMVVIEVHSAPGQVAAAQLTTTAAWPTIYVPLIQKGVSP